MLGPKIISLFPAADTEALFKRDMDAFSYAGALANMSRFFEREPEKSPEKVFGFPVIARYTFPKMPASVVCVRKNRGGCFF